MTSRQAQANVNYRHRVYQNLIDNGTSSYNATIQSERASIRYSSKQIRYRAESIVHTELAFASSLFPLSELESFGRRSNEQGVQLPPLHPRCRCTIQYREVRGLAADSRRFSNALEANAYFGGVDTNKPFGSWCALLTETEKAAVAQYTGKGYSEINGFMRGNLKPAWLDEDDVSRLKTTAALLESALSKFELPDDLHIVVST